MRENLLNCPEDAHSWFTAWKLCTAPNGCYAAKRDIRYDVHFDEPRTPQQIAYSNDRYRLMHEMYQKHPAPVQSFRWNRTKEGEVNLAFLRKVGPWVSMTYDSEMFASLGITTNVPIRTNQLPSEYTSYVRTTEADAMSEKLRNLMGDKINNTTHWWFNTTEAENSPITEPWLLDIGFVGREGIFLANIEEKAILITVALRGHSLDWAVTIETTKPTITGKEFKTSTVVMQQSELKQLYLKCTVEVIREAVKHRESQSRRIYIAGIDPAALNAKPIVLKMDTPIAQELMKDWMDNKNQPNPLGDSKEFPKGDLTTAMGMAILSTLSPQDLESLSNSKVTFGLTKDNIAHIESSLAAKDYDATYAHHFWVQMGKDCNWEPLTLALYYFRYRDKKYIYDQEEETLRRAKKIVPEGIDLLEELKKPITETYLVSKGFKMEGYNNEQERTKIYTNQYLIVHSHRAFGFVVAAKDKEGNVINASWHDVTYQFEIEKFYSEFTGGEKLGSDVSDQISPEWLTEVGFNFILDNNKYNKGCVIVKLNKPGWVARSVGGQSIGGKGGCWNAMYSRTDVEKFCKGYGVWENEPSKFATTWKRISEVNLKIEAKITHEWLLAKGFTFCGYMKNMSDADYVLYFPKHVSFFVKKTWRGIMIDENGEPKRRYEKRDASWYNSYGSPPNDLLGYAIVIGEDNHPKGTHDDWDYALHVKTKEEVEGFIKEHLAK